MVKFFISMRSCENDRPFFAYSNYSLDNREDINMDALTFKLFELIFRFPERGESRKIIFAK